MNNGKEIVLVTTTSRFRIFAALTLSLAWSACSPVSTDTGSVYQLNSSSMVLSFPSEIQTSDSLTITAIFADADLGAVEMVFKVGDQERVVACSEACSTTWDSLPSGTYEILVLARDSTGATVDSASGMITVKALHEISGPVEDLEPVASSPSTPPSPPPSVPKVDTIGLPIEVIGAQATSREVFFDIGEGDYDMLPANLIFRSQIYGLDYANKARIQINSSFDLPLNNSTVGMTSRQKVFQGIGGAYSTLKIYFNVPKTALVVGKNMIRFVFTGTDGTSIGFRVLNFNLETGSKKLISQDRFVNENPNEWKPPFGDATSIAKGKQWWNSAPLIASVLPGAKNLRAKCSDCHTNEGLDLKYFNYSNHVIVERAKFHGLTEQQGKEIASYIRTLDTPNPGRPWNPPYQPGPGIDSKPASEWAAGAGVEWVLDHDDQSYAYMFPKGIPRELDLGKMLNHREIPIAIELPVWNHWLPRIHPLDYWGDNFDNNPYSSLKPDSCNKGMVGFDSQLRKGGAPAYNAMLRFSVDCVARPFVEGFIGPSFAYAKFMPPQAEYSERDNIAKYSFAQWTVVKAWGIMRKYSIEGQAALAGQQGYGKFRPYSDSNEVPERYWDFGQFFRVAPHVLHLSGKGHGIRNGSQLMWSYFSASWYYLQMITDANMRSGDTSTHWPYMIAFAGLYAGEGADRHRGSATTTVSLIKMMESYYNKHLPSAGGVTGWSGPLYQHMLGDVSPSTVSAYYKLNPNILIPLTEMLQRTYLKRTKSFTREQHMAGPHFSSKPVTDLNSVTAISEKFNQRFYHVLKNLVATNLGGKTIDKDLTNEMVDYGKMMWPEIAAQFEALRR